MTTHLLRVIIGDSLSLTEGLLAPVGSLVASALAILLPFFVPFLAGAAVALFRQISGTTHREQLPSKKAFLLWLSSNSTGLLALICGLMAGLYSYGLATLLMGISPSASLVEDLRFSVGVPRLVTLLLVGSIVSSLCAAAGGAIQWLLLKRQFPNISLAWWVRENTLLWPGGFMLSLVLSVVGGAFLPCVPPLLVLAFLGVTLGYSYGERLQRVAQYHVLSPHS